MALRISDEQAKALGIERHIPKRAKRATTKNDKGQNKTEARYDDRLEFSRREGLIRGYWFETIKIRIGDHCWYTPDFLIELPDRSKVIHEVKSTYIREDSWIKLKAAAEHSPFPYFLARWTGRGWEITRIGGRGMA
jgi:hypothetical protein